MPVGRTWKNLKEMSIQSLSGLFHIWKRSRKASGGLAFEEEIESRLLNILHQSSLACATVASVPRKQKASMTATRSYMSGALLLYWQRSSKYESVPGSF